MKILQLPKILVFLFCDMISLSWGVMLVIRLGLNVRRSLLELKELFSFLSFKIN